MKNMYTTGHERAREGFIGHGKKEGKGIPPTKSLTQTLGIIVRGSPESLGKLRRMVRGCTEVQVVFLMQSENKLWIHEEPPQRRRRRQRQKPARGKGGKITIDGELYDRREIEGIMWEWQKEGIIR